MSITAILLAAGRGTRMLTDIPKPLLPILGEPLLQRTLRQLHETGITDIVVITGHQAAQIRNAALDVYPHVRFWHNDRYAEDRNIGSLHGGLQLVSEEDSALVIEADVALSGFGAMLLGQALKSHATNTLTSFWTACGTFRPDHMTGGILRIDESGNLCEIRYSKYTSSLESWLKNLGIIHIAPQQRNRYVELLSKYAATNLDQYFMTPWAEHIDELPATVLDLTDRGGISFNTPLEYQRAEQILRTAEGSFQDIPGNLQLVDAFKLCHIEGYSLERAQWLARKILDDGMWTTPLAVSERDYLVMDGQHRMEAARILGLSKVPVVCFMYDDIPIYSLRPDEYSVSVSEIRRRVASNDIYPYKTVKHILPMLERACAIPLEKLK